MCRPKNTATAQDVSKLLRLNVSQLQEEKFMVLDLEQVVCNHVQFILDLLKAIPRPTVTLLTSAAALCWESMDPSVCKAFATRIIDSITHCRIKAKSCTSGKKLSPSVRRVVQALFPDTGKALPSPSSKLPLSTSSSSIGSKQGNLDSQASSSSKRTPELAPCDDECMRSPMRRHDILIVGLLDCFVVCWVL